MQESITIVSVAASKHCQLELPQELIGQGKGIGLQTLSEGQAENLGLDVIGMDP